MCASRCWKSVGFPSGCSETYLRQGQLIKSAFKNFLILVELTVPWEQRVALAHELKLSRNDQFVSGARQKSFGYV